MEVTRPGRTVRSVGGARRLRVEPSKPREYGEPMRVDTPIVIGGAGTLFARSGHSGTRVIPPPTGHDRGLEEEVRVPYALPVPVMIADGSHGNRALTAL